MSTSLITKLGALLHRTPHIATTQVTLAGQGAYSWKGLTWPIPAEQTVTVRCPMANDPLAHAGLPVWCATTKTITPTPFTITRFNKGGGITQRGQEAHRSTIIHAAPPLLSLMPHLALSATTRSNLEFIYGRFAQFTPGTLLETAALYTMLDPATGRLLRTAAEQANLPTDMPHVGLHIGCDRFLQISGYEAISAAISPNAQRELNKLTKIDLLSH